MKKSLIAGAGVAALGFAALPFAGVFAVDKSIVDTVSVEVSASCQIGDKAGDADTSISRTFSATGQVAGALVTLSKTSGQDDPFVIKCNANKGYTLTPTFEDLTFTGATDPIEYSATTEAAAESGTWTAYYSKNGGTNAVMTSGTAIEGASTMTDTYSFTYKVGLGENQPTGTYSGTATYVLAAKN